MMIDNTEVIREVVKEHQAYPTHESARKMIEDVEFMEKLDEISNEFKPYAKEAYREFQLRKMTEKVVLF